MKKTIIATIIALAFTAAHAGFCDKRDYAELQDMSTSELKALEKSLGESTANAREAGMVDHMLKCRDEYYRVMRMRSKREAAEKESIKADQSK